MLRAIPAGGELGLVSLDRVQWRTRWSNGAAMPEVTSVRVAKVHAGASSFYRSTPPRADSSDASGASDPYTAVYARTPLTSPLGKERSP